MLIPTDADLRRIIPLDRPAVDCVEQALAVLATKPVAMPLGDVIAGLAPGRTSDAAVTSCDLTGAGVQDTTIATLAHHRAAGDNVGKSFDPHTRMGAVS